MLYDVETPEAYLAAIDDDWRKAHLLALRDLILTSFPEGKEIINYKMLAYQHPSEDDMVFHLNAQRRHVGLYVGRIENGDPDGTLLDGLDMGKGCVRFKRSDDPQSEGVRIFIDNMSRAARNAEDVGC